MSVIVKCGGGENVKAEVEYQTPVITQILEGLVGKAQGANATADKILEGYSAYVGQELLNGTATKSGLYVWKKYTVVPKQTVTFQFVQENHTATPIYLQVQCDTDVFSIVDADTFVGYSGNVSGGTSYSFSFDSGGVFNFNQTASTYAYDKESHKLAVVYGSIQQIYTWPEYTVELDEYLSFLDYVVSYNPTTYPDGGEQDGYWYEKVSEFSDLLVFTGCTKMAVDKITFAGSYYADNREINHTLGVIPKIALLVAPIEAVFDGTSAPNTYMPYILGAFPKSGNQGRTAGLAGNGTNGAYVTTYGNYESTATTSTVKFRISDSSYYYRGGVEYTLITMA